MDNTCPAVLIHTGYKWGGGTRIHVQMGTWMLAKLMKEVMIGQTHAGASGLKSECPEHAVPVSVRTEAGQGS